MWDTCSVQFNVRLPREVAAEVEEAERSDPEFLSRIVLYGLTRRSIYRRLRDDGVMDSGRASGGAAEGMPPVI